jgi:hypothetical protein
VHDPFRRPGLIVLVGLMAFPAAPALSASTSRHVDRDAAYLEQAFSHDLCTRDDRGLRKLTKALGKKPIVMPQ